MAFKSKVLGESEKKAGLNQNNFERATPQKEVYIKNTLAPDQHDFPTEWNPKGRGELKSQDLNEPTQNLKGADGSEPLAESRKSNLEEETFKVLVKNNFEPDDVKMVLGWFAEKPNETRAWFENWRKEQEEIAKESMSAEQIQEFWPNHVIVTYQNKSATCLLAIPKENAHLLSSKKLSSVSLEDSPFD